MLREPGMRWGRTGAGKEVSVCRNGGRICVVSGSLSPCGLGLEAEEEKGETSVAAPGQVTLAALWLAGRNSLLWDAAGLGRSLEEELLPLGAAALLHQLQTPGVSKVWAPLSTWEGGPHGWPSRGRAAPPYLYGMITGWESPTGWGRRCEVICPQPAHPALQHRSPPSSLGSASR